MDVVRITQALRQQNPGRHTGNSSARGGSAFASSPSSPTESSSSPVSLRRETWDAASLTVNTSVAASSSSAGQSSSSSPPSSASPSSTFSLASYLPAAVLEASSGFFGTSNANNGTLSSRMNLAAVAGSTNLAEMEVQSLLLRSMPMFGNLISKE